MKYTVVWKQAAEDELAQLWNEAADRDAVRQAADRMEKLLATQPLALGESRTGSMRIAFESPLGMFFDVSEQDRLVSVVRVWRVD